MSLRFLSLALAAGALLAPAARAVEAAGEDDPHAACRAAAAEAEATARREALAALPAARVELARAALLDQEGARVEFPAAALGQDVVVMDFVFTSCTTICPVLSAKFQRLQERLAGSLGRGARLVSVSVDPARDTPARLKAYAGKWKAGPGWSFLTGEKEEVDRVLKGLGAYTPRFTDHPPMVLVGDGRTGTWARFNGFPDVERIAAHVEGLLASRAATAAAGGAR